jgi:tRNA-2-methylthio-N6-dimethylallyladenosine synthase
MPATPPARDARATALASTPAESDPIGLGTADSGATTAEAVAMRPEVDAHALDSGFSNLDAPRGRATRDEGSLDPIITQTADPVSTNAAAAALDSRSSILDASPSPRYHIWTIGCQMNVADSNHVAAELEKIGYLPTASLDEADVVVLNTCVVRQAAEEKAMGKIGSLKPWKQARANRTIALMGCMVGVKPSPKLMAAYPHVDVFMPPSEAAPLVNALRRPELDAEMAAVERAQAEERHRLQDEAEPAVEASTWGQSIKHLALSGAAPVAAHVPIVYGCSHACTFCIIPFRRGVERSRPVAEIVGEIRGLVEQGVREVTLLGQIVDRYGYDWREAGAGLGNSATVSAHQGSADGGFDLADLLHAVHAIDGLWRIRFLTSHPNYMTRRILETVRDLPKVMPQIEVPIQAGDDEILEQMKRGYSRAEFLALIDLIRDVLPDAAIHTDIIVGFSGERDAHFEATRRVLEEVRFDKVHLARYSPRPGTVSERRMVDDVPEEEKMRRHKLLEAQQEIISLSLNQARLGEIVEVLVEDEAKGRWRGRTRHNKLVHIEQRAGEPSLRGRLVEAQVTWAGPWSMQGRFVRDVSAG